MPENREFPGLAYPRQLADVIAKDDLPREIPHWDSGASTGVELLLQLLRNFFHQLRLEFCENAVHDAG